MAQDKGGYSEDTSKQLEEKELTSHEDDDDDVEFLVPDGGWGWVVCAASFMVNFILDGTMFSFGILLLELLDDLQESKSVTSWVGSALLGMSMLMGPMVSMLLKRFSIRTVTIAGTLVATAGFIASVFAPNVFVLIIMYGIVGGTGFSMIFMPAIIVVGLYFNKRRAIATGIATSGSGLGTFTYAYLCDYLLRLFTWRQTILILTGILLNCLACGMVFRPLVLAKRRRRSKPDERNSPPSSGKEEGSSCDSKSSSTYYEFEEGEKAAMVKTESKRRGSGEGVVKEVVGEEGKGNCECLHQSAMELAEVGKKHEDLKALCLPSQQLDPSRHRHRRRHNHHQHRHEDNEALTPPNKLHSSTEFQSSLPPFQILGGRLYSSVDNFRGHILKTQAFPDGEKGLVYFSETQLAPPSAQKQSRKVAKEHITQGLLRPILRKDIYYSGSVNHLAEFQQCGSSMTSFLAHMTQAVSDDSGCSVSTAVGNGEKGGAGRKCGKCVRSVVDVELFGNKAFLLLLVTFTMWTVQSVVLTYLPNLAVSKGVSRDQAALLISIVGITNIAGRIVAGILTDMSRKRGIWLYIVALFVASAVTYGLPWYDSFALFAAASAVFGLCMAVAVSMRTIVLAEQLGIRVLTQSFGVVALFQGVAFTVNPPIAGKLFDDTGAYFWPFTMSGTMYLISALSSLAVGLWFKPYVETNPSPLSTIVRISVEEIVCDSSSSPDAEADDSSDAAAAAVVAAAVVASSSSVGDSSAARV